MCVYASVCVYMSFKLRAHMSIKRGPSLMM